MEIEEAYNNLYDLVDEYTQYFTPQPDPEPDE